MAGSLSLEGQPSIAFLPLHAFRLVGEKLVGVKKVVQSNMAAFMKNARAIITLVGKPFLQLAVAIKGNPAILGDMANAAAALSLKKTGPPRPSIAKRAFASFSKILGR